MSDPNNCPVCDEICNKYNMEIHLQKHNEEAERVMKEMQAIEINAIDAAMNRVKEGK